jgi:hypothetical protein
MKKIEIADERIAQVIGVAKENIKVAITESAPQTFQVWENESIVEKTLEVMQSPAIITLKDLDAEISNLTLESANLNSQVERVASELQKKTALKIELEKVVQSAYDANEIALLEKEAEQPPIEP